MKITVHCYSGYRVDETPKRIYFDARTVKVLEVLDRWLAQDHRYFKVIGDDGATYIIRQDTASMDWELIYYKRAVAKD